MKRAHGHVAGKIVPTLFGLLFCIVPGILLWSFARLALQARAVRDTWMPTPCTIVSSEVQRADNDRYRFSVKYRYEAGGGQHVSATYSPWGKDYSFSSVSERAKLLDAYAPETSATCFVNPANPDEAVLAPEAGDSPPGFVFAFLGLFFAVGLGFAGLPWCLSPKPKREEARVGGTKPPSSGRSLAEILFPVLFCGAFIAVGGGVMSIGLRGKARTLAARDWTLVEGTVERSEVRRTVSHGKGGRSRWHYEPYVAYSYEVYGTRYENDRRSFLNASESSSERAERFVEEHPVGAKIGVRVNPADPADSVLDGPEPTGVAPYLPIGAGAVFALFGAGFLFVMLTSQRDDAVPDATPSATGVLRRKSRRAELVQTLVFTTMWCSLCALLDAAFLSGIDWPPRGEDWIPLVFLGVFTCIGAGLVVRSISLVFRQSGPHLEITCGRGFIARGMETLFSYRLVGGRVEDVESVVVWLVGQRRTTVRRRNGTRVEKREFSRTEVLRAMTPHEIGQGFFRVELPADALPSGRDGNDTLGWTLVAEGRKKNGGKFRDTYPVEVR